MKFPPINYRLIINGFFISIIFAFALFPSPSSAKSDADVSNTKISSKMPGLSKVIFYAPEDPPVISIDSVIVQEDTGATTDAVFTVELGEEHKDTVTVDYTTLNGTAIEPGDYITETGTVTFTTGITTQLITITVQGDYLDEVEEIFNVVLSNASPITATIPIDTGVGTITDDDEAGVTVSSPSGTQTTEAGGFITFTVSLDSEPTEVVTVTLNVTDTTEGEVSVDWLEFTAANWNTAQDVMVTGLNDDVDDGVVAYTVTLAVISDDPNYAVLDPDDIGLTNLDDDAAGVTVSSPSGTQTTEAGGFITFMVELDSEPTEVVTVTLNVTDATEGDVSVDWLEFTDADWDSAQEVTVTGLNDDVEDGNVAYTVELAVISDDPLYVAIDPDNIGLTNLDDDAAGVTVSSPSGTQTTEVGGFITFTVSLVSEPTEVVTVTLNVADTTEGEVSVDWLEFTDANWGTAQEVTVTGLNDDVEDGNVAYTVELAVISDDPLYDPIILDDISLTNLDDDTAGMTIFPTSGLTTTEIGGTDSFTVALTSQPTALVTITLTSSNLEEGTVLPASLVFTDTDWDIPQPVTITGVDDFVDDGDQIYTIVSSAVSNDPNYNGLDVADVSVTNNDNDTAGIIVNPIADLITTEGGGTDTFTMVLSSQPTATVTVTLSSSDTGEGVISTDSLVFTDDNWDSPQTVTVTGVDDFAIDGDILFTIITDAAVSNDPQYNLMDPDDVSVTNSDDDAAGIIVRPTSGLATTELGGTATFTVVLESEPVFSVTLNITSSNPTEGTVSPPSLVFLATNWNIPQDVTITGVDDDTVDGDVSYTIQTAAAISDDENFSGVNPPDVTVINADDDVAGITITPTSAITTTEMGGSDTFTVVLDTQPIASVIVVLLSSDTNEGTVSPSPLTFTASNWFTPTVVTVTGVDDNWDDGDQPYHIQMLVSSGDLDYDNMDLTDVSVANVDDDTAGFTVDPISGLTTTEAGGSDRFTIRLTSQPTANVRINLESSDSSEGSIAPTSLFFYAANWNFPQEVTVTGEDDLIEDGNIMYQIITQPAISGDSNYSDLNAVDVEVTNLDDDSAGIIVDPISGLNTTEAGGIDTFNVVLISPPTAPVTINLSSSDPSEGLASPDTLTFTSANWNTLQTATVTGQEDLVDDGDIAYSITLLAESADSDYDNYSLPDVNVTNLDDDHTPVAEPDTYITNGTLQVAAPGVLGNDSDADSQDTLHAVLQTGVGNGALTLNDNGSFEYIPDPTFTGEDEFTYKASDGTNSSSSVQVTIVVDRDEPTVEWLLPVKPGEQMEITEDRTIQLEASAIDNFDIERVRFRRWDAVNQVDWIDIDNVYTQPYQTYLDTSTLNCGYNQINVEAYDTAGNNTVDNKSGSFIWLIRYCYVYMPSVIK